MSKDMWNRSDNILSNFAILLFYWQTVFWMLITHVILICSSICLQNSNKFYNVKMSKWNVEWISGSFKDVYKGIVHVEWLLN